MRTLSYKPGEAVRSQGDECLFERALDFERALVTVLARGRTEVRPLDSVESLEGEAAQAQRRDLSQVSRHDWNVAKQRYRAIVPMLGRESADAVAAKAEAAPRAVAAGETEVGPTDGSFLERVEPAQAHFTTLYRWKRRFEKTGLLTSLLPERSGPKPGTRKLTAAVETVIDTVVRERYLSVQKATAATVCEEVLVRCRQAGLDAPHPNTVRNRLAQVREFDKLHRREGIRAAEQAFSPNEGQLEAGHPLAVVQMDHTLLDVMLVDDESRLSIGRPWITVAFDVATRMVLGFYLSLDPPGALATGQCLARAVMKKTAWLLRLGLAQTEWPCWGLPDAIHLDNAKEFRGEMLARACEQYGIEIMWRPVARPNWGGHIERYMLAFAQKLKELPGATFGNPEARGDYDSEGKAALTLTELERYLALFICDTYHRRVHSALGRSPLDAWNRAILGDATCTGIGLPRYVSDPGRFFVDLLPFEERSVNAYGVLIDGIHYYSDVLRPLINSRLPGKYRVRRRYVFRRDPRDISRVHFWDEDNETYHVIPFRNTGRPALSLWELRATRRYLKEQRQNADDEGQIFAALARLRHMADESVRTTRKARREVTRRRMHEARPSTSPSSESASVTGGTDASSRTPHPEAEQPAVPTSDEDLSRFNAFDDLEMG